LFFNLNHGIGRSIRIHLGIENLLASVTTAASQILTYEQERLLTGFHNQLVSDQFAQKSDTIPAGKGDTSRWHRKIKLARNTTALTAATDITAKNIYTTDISAQALEYGDGVKRERIVELTSKHLRDWDEMVDCCATQAAESLDYLGMKLLAQNAYRMRVDNDTTFQVDVSATSDGSTTTFVSTSLTQADDFWNGGYITCTSPETTTYADRANYCESRLISDFDNGTNTVTHAAFPATTKSASTAHLCVATGVVVTDKITTAAYGLGVRQLKRNLGVRFNDAILNTSPMQHKEVHNLPPASGGAGYWVCILNTDTEYDFMNDVTWSDVGKYQKSEWLTKGEVGKWMGTKAFATTQPWRETVTGTEDESSGVVQPVHFLAQDAYGISSVAAPGAEQPFGLVLNLMTSRDLGEKVPRLTTAGWIAYYAIRSLNSLWNVAMLGGATA